MIIWAHVTALAGMNLGTASPASAAIDVGGNCPEMCLTFFYNTGYQGSRFVISYNGSGTNGIPNLAGYNFVTSGAGQGQPVKNNAASASSAYEKRVARNDVACKDEVDLVDRWYEAESKMQKEMIRENVKELGRLKEFHEGVVEKARSLLIEARN
ncbi:hypothetical protein [Streptomyces albogriseolus]|uniref:hypothetical protein n=1 Tax=Streptomyces albogriseolus TaxID=1887 RepID=UPI003D73CE46